MCGKIVSFFYYYIGMNKKGLLKQKLHYHSYNLTVHHGGHGQLILEMFDANKFTPSWSVHTVH